jgi:hypothetical protein
VYGTTVTSESWLRAARTRSATLPLMLLPGESRDHLPGRSPKVADIAASAAVSNIARDGGVRGYSVVSS